MRKLIVGFAGTVALAVAGCGSSDFANVPRPPTPIVISAAILPRRVTVSPASFGAGLITLVVANESRLAQQLAVARVGAGAQTLVSSGPIHPQDTATLQLDLDPGRYRVRIGRSGIRATTLHVGRKRASAQNQLLSP